MSEIDQRQTPTDADRLLRFVPRDRWVDVFDLRDSTSWGTVMVEAALDVLVKDGRVKWMDGKGFRRLITLPRDVVKAKLPTDPNFADRTDEELAALAKGAGAFVRDTVNGTRQAARGPGLQLTKAEAMALRQLAGDRVQWVPSSAAAHSALEKLRRYSEAVGYEEFHKGPSE